MICVDQVICWILWKLVEIQDGFICASMKQAHNSTILFSMSFQAVWKPSHRGFVHRAFAQRSHSGDFWPPGSAKLAISCTNLKPWAHSRTRRNCLWAASAEWCSGGFESRSLETPLAGWTSLLPSSKMKMVQRCIFWRKHVIWNRILRCMNGTNDKVQHAVR